MTAYVEWRAMWDRSGPWPVPVLRRIGWHTHADAVASLASTLDAERAAAAVDLAEARRDIRFGQIEVDEPTGDAS